MLTVSSQFSLIIHPSPIWTVLPILADGSINVANFTPCAISLLQIASRILTMPLVTEHKTLSLKFKSHSVPPSTGIPFKFCPQRLSLSSTNPKRLKVFSSSFIF